VFTPGTAMLWGLVVPCAVLSAWAGYVHVYLPWSVMREARRLMARLDRLRVEHARIEAELDRTRAEHDRLLAERAELKARLNGF
jgi:hypothetical protein